eukprot:8545490-Heterocapsa_arctica.AAC.1
MEHCFVLPPVRASLLVAAGVSLPTELAEHTTVSPLMMALPMGFNWALYFCQRILEGAVLK